MLATIPSHSDSKSLTYDRRSWPIKTKQNWHGFRKSMDVCCQERGANTPHQRNTPRKANRNHPLHLLTDLMTNSLTSRGAVFLRHAAA